MRSQNKKRKNAAKFEFMELYLCFNFIIFLFRDNYLKNKNNQVFI